MDATTPNIFGPTYNVGSCCVRVGSSVQTDATTLKNAKTCSASVRLKDTTHKTLQIQIRQPSWSVLGPNNFRRGGCEGDHGTKEILGVGGSEVRPVSNFAKQLSTTRNKMQ